MRTVFDGPWLRAASLAVLLVTGLVLAVVVGLPDAATVRGWVHGAGGAGLIGLGVCVALVLLAPVPRTAVSVAVGVVAGFGAGVVLAFAGALLAALVAFVLARTLGRSAAERLAGLRLARVDRLMAHRGFVAVLLARLLPVVPFVVVNYGAGLTGARLAPYLLATALGILPSTVVQVGLGASATVVADRAPAWTVGPLVAVVLVLGVLGAARWRRRRAAATPAG